MPQSVFILVVFLAIHTNSTYGQCLTLESFTCSELEESGTPCQNNACIPQTGTIETVDGTIIEVAYFECQTPSENKLGNGNAVVNASRPVFEDESGFTQFLVEDVVCLYRSPCLSSCDDFGNCSAAVWIFDGPEPLETVISENTTRIYERLTPTGPPCPELPDPTPNPVTISSELIGG